MAENQRKHAGIAGNAEAKSAADKPSATQKNPDAIYQVENAIPAGSADKSRAHAGEPDEQYAIPGARPNPFSEYPPG